MSAQLGNVAPDAADVVARAGLYRPGLSVCVGV